MKNTSCFAIVLVAMLTFGAAPAAAQDCQMYTYSDMWFDDAGNVVGLNYTDGDTYCADFSVQADVTVLMPSGYSQYSFANGSCCAEAISVAPTEFGDGSLSGTNELDAACISPLFASFSSLFGIGESFTWYEFAFGTTFTQMQPCPEPGSTISCTSTQTVFTDARDIQGLFVEFRHPWIRVFGRKVCSPLVSRVAWQNTAPDRPYCFDLP